LLIVLEQRCITSNDSVHAWQCCNASAKYATPPRTASDYELIKRELYYLRLSVSSILTSHVSIARVDSEITSGFGDSSDVPPSEVGLVTDARAMWDWLTTGTPVILTSQRKP
jgi:hypothetical protein